MPPDTRSRRLTARSVILSVLLGAHPPEAHVSGIVRVGTELGLQASAIRAALTRLVATGDLERHSEGVYLLSARLAERQRRQDRAVSPEFVDWDGQWRMAIVRVSASDAATRGATRCALQAARLGELREGVWTRPNNITIQLAQDVSSRVTWFTGAPGDDPKRLAHELFAPTDWNARAHTLLTEMGKSRAVRNRFEVAAAMVRHILNDPLLPPELLPSRWKGEQLRQAYGNYRNEFTRLAETLLAEATAGAEKVAIGQ